MDASMVGFNENVKGSSEQIKVEECPNPEVPKSKLASLHKNEKL